jgi:hypothetical protein
MASGKAVLGGVAGVFFAGFLAANLANCGGETDRGEYADQLGSRTDKYASGKPFDRDGLVMDAYPGASRGTVDAVIRLVMRNGGEEPNFAEDEPTQKGRAVAACGLVAANGVVMSDPMRDTWSSARGLERVDDHDEEELEGLYEEAANLCLGGLYAAGDGGQLKQVAYPAAYTG